MNHPRPATVTVAFALQLALVGLLLVMIGAIVADAIHYDGLIDRAALATDPDPGEVGWERSANVSFAAVAGGITLALAVWLGVTAFGVRGESTVARILTLVALGLPLLAVVGGCAAMGLVGVAFLGMLGSAEPVAGDADLTFGDEPSAEDFYSELDRLSADGWSTAWGVLGSVTFAFAAMVAVAVVVLVVVSMTRRRVPPPRFVPVYYWSGHPRA